MSARWICRLKGCVAAEHYPACERCEAHIYEDFIQYGWLEPLFRACRRARRVVQMVTGKRCTVCHRRYWRGYDELTCSDKCFSDWLPF